MAERESIEGIVDEEGENLSPEERARLTEKMGQHFVRRLIRTDNRSRIDEVSRLEDYTRREAPLLKRDLNTFTEYLLLRRTELTMNGPEGSEIAWVVRTAHLAEVGHVIEFLKTFAQNMDTFEGSVADLAELMLDFVEHRQEQIMKPEGGDQ